VSNDLKKKPLTDDEIAALWPGLVCYKAVYEFARAIEKHHSIAEEDSGVSGVQTDVRDTRDVTQTPQGGRELS
jgi:hypothetical protein